MKLLLAATPFRAPTAPPFGLACLKATLGDAVPRAEVVCADWNLALFRRWLLEEPPQLLCQEHPDELLSQVCPHLLVAGGAGRTIWDALCTLPDTAERTSAYMNAALQLGDVDHSLKTSYDRLLTPYIEQRAELSQALLEDLFAHELAHIEAYAPDVLGLSVLTEASLTYALALARAAKERFKLRVVLGGSLLSHVEADELLNTLPWIDWIVFGEGEHAVPTLVQVLADPNGSLEDVPSLAHRKAGRVCIHDEAPPPNVHNLPFADFRDFPVADYLSPAPLLPMITSRGCYWGKCTFCSHTRPYAPGVRVRTAAHVADELEEQMRRHGVRHFLFVDEAISPKTLGTLSQEIGRRQLDIRFGAEGVRVEQKFDEGALTRAYDAGLRWIYVGIESASQRLLDLMDKGITVEAIERFIAACEQARIVPELSFIVGLPGTTYEDLDNDIAFVRRYPTDSGSFVLLLGSPMHRRPLDFGIRIEDRAVLYHTAKGPIHAPRFFFTTTDGPSPVAADRYVESKTTDARRMRPHVGEVHAVVLADVGFFDSEERPPALPTPPERALAHLEAGVCSGHDTLPHTLGCLEQAGEFERAWQLLQEHLSAFCDDSAWVTHAVALLSQGGRPDLAIRAAQNAPLSPATHGQLMRAQAMAGNAEAVVAHAQACLAGGYETAELHAILAQAYQRLARPEEAAPAYREAELRNWYAPELNEQRAECLRLAKKHKKARDELDKATRKQTWLAR